MRKITAWILTLAVLMSMGCTALAETEEPTANVPEETVLAPVEDETETEESTEPTETEDEETPDETEEEATPLRIGGADLETDIAVAATTPTNLASGATATNGFRNAAAERVKVNDGSMSTNCAFYSGSTLDKLWITIDFGKKTTFNNMKIYAKLVHRISKWEIRYSDDNATWSVAATGTNTHVTTSDKEWWGSTVFDESFADVKARYVQFRVTEQTTYSAQGTQFYEVEVYNNVSAKPVITLNGDAQMELWQGETFTDPGATAVGVDGKTDLTSAIKVSGSVNTNTPGTYTLSYSVDEVVDGNTVSANTVTRKVKVKSTGVDLAYTSALSGGVVSASYDKTEYDPANGATYQWMRATASGGEYTNIEGATDATYTLSGADSGTYIKLMITPANGTPVVTANHVSVGNLVLGKSVTQEKANVSKKPVTNINDGNADTDSQGYGSSTYGIYTFDLGAQKDISLVRMYTKDSTAKKIKHFTIEYTTSTSGNTDWHVAKDVTVDTTDTGSLNAVTYTFDSVKARRVRLNMDSMDATYSGTWYITEFEVYHAPSTAPTMTLNGDVKVMVEQNTTFTDPGVSAKDGADADISALVRVSGEVDTTTLGTYTLTYNVTDAWGNVAAPVTRTVVVHEKDTTAPVIYLVGAPTIRIHQGDTWTDPGAYALDNLDEAVTVSQSGTVETATLGEYTITYSAADFSGNQAVQVTRTVVVVAADADVVAPTVTLKGDATVEIWQGHAYEESGVTAMDDGQDVSGRVVIGGSVNTAVLGSYVLTYSVTDAAGNIGFASRVVNVVPEPAIEQDKRELQIEGAADLNAITGDLILRVSGKAGSTITWTSSDESVIRPDGTVLRPANGNATVILTATIQNGNETRVKVFDAVTVLQKTGTGGGAGGSDGRPTGGGKPSGGSSVTGSVSGTVGGTTTPGTTTPTVTPSQPSGGTLSGFSDMKEAAWADLAVAELTKRGILNGVGNGTFEPSRAVTREEFVKIIMEACGFATGDVSANFVDVPEDAWYAAYVAAAEKLNIVGGAGDGSFGSGKAISREEMATMIVRAAQAKGITLSQAAGKADFSDDSTIADWAKEAVYALQQAGILNGMGDGSFAPGQQCTRAEAAKVVYELTKYMW